MTGFDAPFEGGASGLQSRTLLRATPAAHLRIEAVIDGRGSVRNRFSARSPKTRPANSQTVASLLHSHRRLGAREPRRLLPLSALEIQGFSSAVPDDPRLYNRAPRLESTSQIDRPHQRCGEAVEALDGREKTSHEND
jgi:hypothetical protein